MTKIITKKKKKRIIKMKKLGAICFGILLLVVGVVAIFCVKTVPAGYVAVQYDVNGGIKNEVLQQGVHIIPPTIQTTLYSVGLEQSYLTSDERGDSKDDESFSASSSEGKALQIDLTFTYQYRPENVVDVFNRFKGQDGKCVRDSFIKPNIISWTKEIIARYKVSDILGAERANINLAITDYLVKKFEPYGITVSNVSLINVEVDEETRNAINAKITAQQNAETQSINNQTSIDKAKADAEVAKTNAQAQADAKMIEAQAEAEANKLLEQSLTDKILRQKYIEKWNGELPKVSGDSSLIIGYDTINERGN